MAHVILDLYVCPVFIRVYITLLHPLTVTLACIRARAHLRQHLLPVAKRLHKRSAPGTSQCGPWWLVEVTARGRAGDAPDPMSCRWQYRALVRLLNRDNTKLGAIWFSTGSCVRLWVCAFYFIYYYPFFVSSCFFLFVPCFASFSCFIACCLRHTSLTFFILDTCFNPIRNPVVLFPGRRFVCWILSLCLKQWGLIN